MLYGFNTINKYYFLYHISAYFCTSFKPFSYINICSLNRHNPCTWIRFIFTFNLQSSNLDVFLPKYIGVCKWFLRTTVFFSTENHISQFLKHVLLNYRDCFYKYLRTSKTIFYSILLQQTDTCFSILQ